MSVKAEGPSGGAGACACASETDSRKERERSWRFLISSLQSGPHSMHLTQSLGTEAMLRCIRGKAGADDQWPSGRIGKSRRIVA
jgi:hypothetical protein